MHLTKRQKSLHSFVNYLPRNQFLIQMNYIIEHITITPLFEFEIKTHIHVK